MSHAQETHADVGKDSPERRMLIRPAVAQVGALLDRLEGAANGTGVRLADLAAAIREEARCSRATAYRSITDAIAARARRRQ